MKTLDQDLKALVDKGVVDLNEARSKAANRDNF
jgi:Tfp pilus assembly pilus retraction ATPase PilT